MRPRHPGPLRLDHRSPARRRHAGPWALAFALAGAAAIAPASAAEFSVDSDADAGPGTLRAAVERANALPGRDLIRIAPGIGTIMLTSGQLEVTDSLVVEGPASGATISAGKRSRIFAVTRPQASLELRHLALSGGRTTGEGVPGSCAPRWGRGGAVCALGDLRVRDGRIVDNHTSGDAAAGGGLYVRGRLLLERVEVRGNGTSGYLADGAGIHVGGEADIVGSRIEGNRASGRQSRGGGIRALSTLRLHDSQVLGNRAAVAAGEGVHLAAGASMASVRSEVRGRDDAASGATARASATAAKASEMTCASIDFGLVPVGTPSPEWTLTVDHAGQSADDVVIEQLALAGANPGPFSFSGDGCSGVTLAVGESCTVRLAGTPPARGSWDARLDIPLEPTVEVPGELDYEDNHVTLAMASVPILSISPASVDFGTVAVGATSAPATISLANAGVADLSVTDIPDPGAPFVISAGSCPATPFSLAPEASCTFNLAFAPGASGNATAQLAIASDSDATGDSLVELEGNAVAPVLAASADAIDFGSQPVGTSTGTQALAIGNTGDADLVLGTLALTGPQSAEFAIASDTCSGATLPPAGECEVALAASPAAAGPRQALLELPSNAADGTTTVTLTVDGIQPVLVVDPTAVDFGPQRVGVASAPRPVVLGNAGSAGLQLGAVGLSGAQAGEFAITEDACSGAVLAPGEQCSLSVVATATTTGTRSAQLDLPSDVPDAPAAVALAVAGIEPALGIDASALDFGEVRVGQVGDARALRLENTGSADLVIGSIELAGAQASEFTLEAGACSGATLAPGEACSLSVAAAPAAAGLRLASIGIPSDAPDAPAVVELRVTGIESLLAASPASLDFGDVVIGSASAASAIVLSNEGTAPITLDALAITGAAAAEFGIEDDACSASTLQPGAGCQLLLTATPGAGGLREARLEARSAALAAPVSVALAVTGIESELALDVPALDFGTLEPGTEASATVLLANEGDAPLGLLSLDGPELPFALASGSCLPLPAELAPGEACSLVLAFRPGASASGSYEGSLRIASTAPDSPRVLPLAGQVAGGGEDPGSQPQPMPAPRNVPVLDAGSLALLVLALGLFGWTAARRHGR